MIFNSILLRNVISVITEQQKNAEQRSYATYNVDLHHISGRGGREKSYQIRSEAKPESLFRQKFRNQGRLT